ncbi:hypothetical protein [Deinococcus aestuarii]|uniref:hypothetical protein n=1 Tax=Deinococcus aestuarii TaxID=2774531 RepID=UPI001C0D2402|nr:hypothetical protein [Deinococcus aestuarii]
MEYDNFIQDFPSRCERLWQGWKRDHPGHGLDDLSVTAMLCIAMPGLLIPMERLQENQRYGSHRDRSLFQQATERVDNLTHRPLSTLPSPWADIIHQARWAIRERPSERSVVATGSFPDNYQLWEFLRVIRNGLAHGNIDTGGETVIRHLSFATSTLAARKLPGLQNGYEIVTLPVSAFRGLLDAWFQLIHTLPLPSGMIEDAAD